MSIMCWRIDKPTDGICCAKAVGMVCWWYTLIMTVMREHHISGPGYYSWPNYDHVYKNKELNTIFDGFIKEIERDARYYEPIH